MYGRKATFLVVLLLILSGTAAAMAGLRTEETQREPQSFSALGSFSGHSLRDALFDRLIERLMELGHFSAVSAAIVKHEELTWSAGYGLFDRANARQADDETIYLIASISKTVTATAVMQLWEQGLLSLDGDVNQYLPFSLRNPHHPDEPITIRMLLSHQSSLATDPSALWGTGMPCIPGDLSIEGYPMPFLQDYLTPGGVQYRPDVWTTAAPGDEMHYANMGYGVLGYIVEELSGMSFEAYCQEHIFMPLDMSNSSFFFSGVDATSVAIPYMYDDGYHSLLHYDMLHYPAGGLRTTVRELSCFLIAHMQGGVYDGIRILEEQTVAMMHAEQGPGYGLGFILWSNGAVGHTGGLFGVVTLMQFQSAEETGVILFTNAGPFTVRQALIWSLIQQLLWSKATENVRELWVEAVTEAFYQNRHLIDRHCDTSLSQTEVAAEVAAVMAQVFR